MTDDPTMTRISEMTVLLAATVPTACVPAATVRDLEGRRIDQLAWEPIGPGESRLSITDPAPDILVRERMILPSRYLERWSFESSHLVYEALAHGGFGPESKSPDYLFRLYGNDLALTRRSIRFTPADVRMRNNLAFVVAHSQNVACFAFVSVFG